MGDSPLQMYQKIKIDAEKEESDTGPAQKRNGPTRVIVMKKPNVATSSTHETGGTAIVAGGKPLDLDEILGNTTSTPPSKPKVLTMADALSLLHGNRSAEENDPNFRKDCHRCIEALGPVEKNICNMESKVAATVAKLKGRLNFRKAQMHRLNQQGTVPRMIVGTPISGPSREIVGTPNAGPSRVIQPSQSSTLVRPTQRVIGMGPDKKYVIRSPALAAHITGPLKKHQTAPPTVGVTLNNLYNIAKPAPKPEGSQLAGFHLLPGTSTLSQTPDPKRVQAANEVAQSKFIQAVLLQSGTSFEYGKFAAKNKDVIDKLSTPQIVRILMKLAEDSILFQEDEDEPKTGVKTLWHKETAKTRLRKLRNYPVTMTDYQNALDEEDDD